MKTTWYLLGCIYIIVSCSTPKEKVDNSTVVVEKMNQLEWLSGKWVRTNDSSGRITYEQWGRDADQAYSGRGFTIKVDESIFEPDTVFKETLRIIAVNDTLVYEVVGINEYPTLFKFIQQTDTSFVCVNPANEFPKKIAYVYYNRHITATISGGDQQMTFKFRKE